MLHRFPAKPRPQIEAYLFARYKAQARAFQGSLPMLGGTSLKESAEAVRDFVLTARAINDPADLLEYFAPLLTLLDLKVADSNDWRRMREATEAMASAGERAGLSSRQMAGLRRGADALRLLEESDRFGQRMDRKEGELAARFVRYDETSISERQRLARDVDRLNRDLREAQHRQAEIRQTLSPPAARRRESARRPRSSRRCQRRVVARRAQADSGGDADGDGDSDPPSSRRKRPPPLRIVRGEPHSNGRRAA